MNYGNGGDFWVLEEYRKETNIKVVKCLPVRLKIRFFVWVDLFSEEMFRQNVNFTRKMSLALV